MDNISQDSQIALINYLDYVSEMHLKFLGLRWPLTSTIPEGPLLPLRSANTSSNLGNRSSSHRLFIKPLASALAT